MWRRKPTNTVLVHSDQGTQFTSMEWTSFLRHHNLQHSMNRRGNCHEWARYTIGPISVKRTPLQEAFSTCSNAFRSTVERTEPETRPNKTCSITSRCSTIQSASKRATECCRQPTSNGARKPRPRISRKLWAIQCSRHKIRQKGDSDLSDLPI